MGLSQWIGKLFRKNAAPVAAAAANAPARPAAAEGCRVLVDDQTVTMVHPDGSRESLAWADLTQLAVQYKPNPPFEPEMCYVLAAGPTKLAIPADIDGEEEFVARMQALPGFDGAPLKAAVAGEKAGTFTCWTKKA